MKMWSCFWADVWGQGNQWASFCARMVVMTTVTLLVLIGMLIEQWPA